MYYLVRQVKILTIGALYDLKMCYMWCIEGKKGIAWLICLFIKIQGVGIIGKID